MNLDVDWLKNTGIKGSEEQLREYANIIYDALELRVGQKIASKLSDEKLAEAEAFTNRDEDIPLEWLEKAVPNYSTYTDTETEKLQKEITDAPDGVAYIKELA